MCLKIHTGAGNIKGVIARIQTRSTELNKTRKLDISVPVLFATRAHSINLTLDRKIDYGYQY